jgi:predicted nucleic acid-binding protein
VTSKPGEKHITAVAGDANVLLSAVLGHAALRVFTRTDVGVLTTRGVLEEVREYLPLIAKQYDMLPQALEGQLRLLAVRECEPEEYATKLEAAKRAIAKRDPDDVELLALALAFSDRCGRTIATSKTLEWSGTRRRGSCGSWASKGAVLVLPGLKFSRQALTANGHPP